jgi:hypothetical protein
VGTAGLEHDADAVGDVGPGSGEELVEQPAVAATSASPEPSTRNERMARM